MILKLHISYQVIYQVRDDMKRKLRKLNKHKGLSEATFQSEMWPYQRKKIETITLFKCEENGIYAESILMYKSYPYRTHDIWIEFVDGNTSKLMVQFDPNIIPDLDPFWAICDTKRFLLGFTKFNQYEVETVKQAYDKFLSSYRFAIPLTPRDKYKIYRKKRSVRTSFEWLLKKSDLKFAKLSKAKKRYYANKKHYTWED